MKLKIRWVKQFFIETGEERHRYDTLWRLPWGEEQQFHVETRERDDALARHVLENKMRSCLASPVDRYLALPKTSPGEWL